MVEFKHYKNKIAINVLSETKYKDELKELLCGIEEEGIPYLVIYKKEIIENEIDLSYELANLSKLSFGVLIKNNNITIHFSKLKKENPLYEIPYMSDLSIEEKRKYGSNIARIIKGVPLKT